MEKKVTGGFLRTVVPAGILCLSLFLALLFSNDGAASFLGSGKAERDRKKQAFLADRTLLSLQLAKCGQYKSSANDAYICGGSSTIYESLASSGDCLLAAEAARDLGLSARDFSIPRTLAPKASSGS
jgi:hypothetical protein